MKVIVGLGNPGPRYETTRHNAGFLMVDLLAEAHRISWESQAKFGGDIGKGTILGETCVLLKPMTYMNLSGRSVGAALRFFKVEAPDLVVLHDDIDVPAGKVKARVGGGHGGHNGIRSIMEETGLADFHRIKLGVGRPSFVGEEAVTSWVLGQMTDEELLALQGPMFDDVKTRIKSVFDGRAAALPG